MLVNEPAKAIDHQEEPGQQDECRSYKNDVVGIKSQRHRHGPGAERGDNRAEDHEWHGKFMKDAFEIHPLAHQQGDCYADECEHDVQMPDNGFHQHGFVWLAHHVFAQESFESIAKIRTGNGAKYRRTQRGNGHRKIGCSLKIDIAPVGLTLVLDVIGFAPGPQRHRQLHTSEEHQCLPGNEQPVKHPVVTQISECQAEYQGVKVARGHCRVDAGLLASCHRHTIRDQKHLDGNNRHGNRVVQHDDPAFAFHGVQIKSEDPNSDVFDPQFRHRAGKCAPDSHHQRKASRGHKHQPPCGAKEVTKSFTKSLH